MHAIVTDSTWSLSPSLAEDLGITVVPLHVLGPEGEFLDSPAIERPEGRLTTSQPSHGELREALERAIGAGAASAMCFHLSSELSGTAAAMETVAAEVSAERGVPIDVVDSRTTGAGLGFAALVAARSLHAGESHRKAISRARECASRARVLLTVDDPRHLQRGGRFAAPQLAIGAALGIRPILELNQGAIGLREMARGAAKARAQLVKGVLTGVPPGRASIAVHHVGDEDSAHEVAEALREAAEGAGIVVEHVAVTPLSLVLAAHTGPGALGAVVAPTFGLLRDL
ncbi:MAG: DegV family protein [Ruaniaceae bacterium]|nr:DegV family protein [Ruaniaceae bacterium]